MFEKINSSMSPIKDHLKRRNTPYATTLGFIAGAIITRKVDRHTLGWALKFIEEKNLSDEFFGKKS